MPRVETSGRDDLTVLVEMLREVSSVADPVSLVSHFGRHFWKIRPLGLMISLSQRGLHDGLYKITRMVRPGEIAEGRSPSDPWRDWDRLETHVGGFLGDVIARPEPQLYRDLRVTEDPVLGAALADMGSCMASPLFDDGRALNWNLYFHPEPDFYTLDHLADHFLTTNLVGTATRNLLAVTRADELNRRLTAQLEAVARVQQALLPPRVPRIPGLKIATSYLTSDEAGGDYYDFFGLPGGRWGILIADVAGHGAAAATVMAMLHAILHSYEGPDYTPGAVLRFANKRLASSRIDSTFVTAFFGVYEPETSVLTYARAGHNPPRLKRGDSGELIAIDDAPGLPLGITEPYEVETGQLRMEHHDTLVLYTDGITEAFDIAREQFGIAGLDRALLGCSGDPECVVDSVHKALYRHTGSLERDDDQTIVALRRVE